MSGGPRSAGRQQSGLTVLEIVLAMAILSMGVVFVVSILPTGVFTLKHAEDMQTAATYGQELIEDARAHPPGGSGVDRDGSVELNHTVFHYQRAIYQVPPDLVDVRVQMNWNTGAVPLVLGTRLYAPKPAP